MLQASKDGQNSNQITTVYFIMPARTSNMILADINKLKSLETSYKLHSKEEEQQIITYTRL